MAFCKGINKRNFLKIMSAALLGTVINSACATNKPNLAASAAKKRILVIGAGLAGLTATNELKNQGHDLVVVEARDRIGGRLWTSTQWEDAPVDLGASWIHGVDGNPLTQLAAQIDAELILSSYDLAVTYAASGSPLSEQAEARLEQFYTKVEDALADAQETDEDQSVEAVVAAAFAQDNLSNEDQQLLNFILNSTIEQEYAGSTGELSAHWYDDAEAFSGDDAFFADGYRLLVEHLSQDVEIELSQTVQEIDWSESQVRVRTDKGDHLADHVIVTLPLGVLKSGNVKFTPALPAANQGAIEELEVGVLNKCYLRFAEAFWPTDVDWLEYVSQQPGEWSEWVSLMRTHNLPVLLGFNAADQGRTIEAWTDEEIVDSAMHTLRTIFGNAIPEPLDYQITRWASDPYAFGSYSFNPVGYTPALREALATPLEQKVFFAGEATERDHFATAHGAYLSGLRVAKEILALPSQTLLYLPIFSQQS